jgi:myosin heavy subunit
MLPLIRRFYLAKVLQYVNWWALRGPHRIQHDCNKNLSEISQLPSCYRRSEHMRVSPTHRSPLQLLVATLCVAFVLFSSLSLYLGFQLRSTSKSYDAVLAGSVRDAETILRMQVGFKTQVQEWKNVLLRGADVEQLTKYRDSFLAEEQKVQETGKGLVASSSDPTVKAKSAEFLAAHETMGASYRTALDKFAASGGKDVKGADAIVKGQDRAPSELLSQLVDHASGQTAEQAKSRDEDARTQSTIAYAATAILMLFVGCAVGVAVRTLTQRIGGNIGRLRQESAGLVQSGSALTTDSEHAESQARTVAGAAQTVSGNVASVAAAVEQMSATVEEIARNASAADAAASTATQRAQATNETVARLGDASAEIGQVIAVITSIAEQTNLLALNATIEAARAGESGKGFAVVANEVKELANQTARATEEISRKIEAIQTQSSDAVAAIGDISEVIAQVNELQSSITGAVEEQSATTSEIGRSVQEASLGMSAISASIDQLGALIQNTTRSAQSTNASSTEVSDVAEQLEQLVRLSKARRLPALPLETWTNPRASERFGSANTSGDTYRNDRVDA